MGEQDEKPESLERYWDPKLETLGEFLDQLTEDGAMDLEELDGFFTALHCCPEPVPPNEYLPEILGDGLENEEIFPNPEAAQLFMGLLMHHWNAVGDALRSEDFFLPLLLEDGQEKTYGNCWAIGFLRGADMRKELWSEILEDEEDKAGWFVPIFALAHEEEPDAELRPYKKPMTDEEREQLLAGISGAVTDIYGYFAPHRKLKAEEQRERELFGKQASKIGRNDPCYCGSGKKYKKCCGAMPVN